MISGTKRRYQKLDVWQKSIQFAENIYDFSREFPKGEKFGLRIQLRKASVSIASNIAEGAGRHHEQEFIRFLRIALGSLYESITQLFVANRVGYLRSKRFQYLYKEATVLSKMINALINSLIKKQKKSINYQPSTNN